MFMDILEIPLKGHEVMRSLDGKFALLDAMLYLKQLCKWNVRPRVEISESWTLNKKMFGTIEIWIPYKIPHELRIWEVLFVFTKKKRKHELVFYCTAAIATTLKNCKHFDTIFHNVTWP